ncbi:WD40/YVTN/BNR-like repeat-containing protein, partial [Bacteroidota bacterium]
MVHRIICSFILFFLLFTSSIFSQWFWQNPLPQGNEILSINFVSDEGWAVGGEGTALLTTDGGVTWALKDLGTTENLRCVYMHSDTQIWIVGENGLILYIYNDGGTLDISQQVSNTTERLNSVRYDLSGCGWICGNNGTVLRTSDLGINWISQNANTTEHLYDMSYVDCNNAWAVGPDGLVIHTTDTGNNWSYQFAPTSWHLL